MGGGDEDMNTLRPLASLVAQRLKRLPPMRETQFDPWIRSLGQEDPPGEGNCNLLQYSCLENPMNRGAWWLQSMGSQTVGHDLVTSLSLSKPLNWDIPGSPVVKTLPSRAGGAGSIPVR